jgi:predicted flap endonuclease-1-like 5' DNA nuclease
VAARGAGEEVEEYSMTYYPIRRVAGVDKEDIAALKQVGIRTAEKLLEEAKSPKGRKGLADRTGIDAGRLLDLANAADHMRIKGMGSNYVGLLRAVGVMTVRELKYRNPENLARAMAEANGKRKLVRVLPSAGLVVQWVEQAKKLPIKITHR